MMIDESKVMQVDLITCTESIEKSLLAIGTASYGSKSFSVNSVKTFTQALESSTFKALSSYISYVFKLTTVNNEEPEQIINMSLLVLVELLSMQEDRAFCELVYKAVYTKAPNLMTAIGSKYGYNHDFDRDTGSIRSGSNSGRGVIDSIENVGLRPTQLANDHWKYVQEVMLQATDGNEDFTIRAVEFTYVSSFIHGWKHAMEEVEIQLNKGK